MNKKTARRQRDLKSKLLAAVAMLLVSSMMMVTSTYAWFTLSTAPEVTGITTAVGANGNLEMALQPYSGDLSKITTDVGDGLKEILVKNTTWGNLVDVSSNTVYGMDKLVLYPAALNANAGKVNTQFPLQTPVYGADGRINKLDANTTTGAYDTDKAQFAESMTRTEGQNSVTYTNAKGVRAIGTSSSLTARELAHRNALAKAVSERGDANIAATRILSAKGSAIGDIAIKHAMNSSAKHKWEEVKPLYEAVTALQEQVVSGIEEAMINYFLAYNIAAAGAEENYADMISAIEGVTTLEAAEALAGTSGIAVPEADEYVAAKGELADLKTAITAASGALSSLEGRNDIEWGELSTAVQGLVNLGMITVNSMTMTEIQADAVLGEDDVVITPDGKSQLITKLSESNYTAQIAMPNGSGIFSDIAAFVGTYSAAFTMQVDITGNGTTMPVKTVMTATSSNSYLTAIADSDDIKFVGADDTGSTNPISTFYGYIIDLAFRTNATNSYLKLQVEGTDRIYGEDGNNADTMGHGASMTFSTNSNTFGQEGAKELMKHIRIVFFDTTTGNIYAYAKLDATNPLEDSGTTTTMALMLTEANFSTPAASEKIMDLNQNQAHALSVMVYLDGSTVQNEDVAADMARSMTGSMNLQFASSATLVPMEYNDLKNGTSSVTPTEPTVDLSGVESGTTGYTVSNAKKQGNSIGFVLTAEDGYDLANKTVTVDFGGGNTAPAQDGTVAGVTGYGVTIPAGVTVEATTQITVTVTDANP